MSGCGGFKISDLIEEKTYKVCYCCCGDKVPLE